MRARRSNHGLATLGLACLFASADASAQPSGFVYVATNEVTTNRVKQYRRAPDGSLTFLREASTGGRGGNGNGYGYSMSRAGSPGAQDSLVLTRGGSLLLVVNSGSGDVSSMSAGNEGLHLIGRIASGGSSPSSVAVNGDLVYVLNTQTPNISGFRMTPSGTLEAMVGSTRDLPGGGAALTRDIVFSPDGSRLLVAEGGTSRIDVFQLDGRGLVTGVAAQPIMGAGPFALRFDPGGLLLSAEADSGSVSSYFLGSQETLSTISGVVSNKQNGTCCLSITSDARFAFASNTTSSTISSYRIAMDGTLRVENAVAAALVDGTPADSALSRDGSFLYVEDSASGRLVSFRSVGPSLTPIGLVTGLPATLHGIAAE